MSDNDDGAPLFGSSGSFTDYSNTLAKMSPEEARARMREGMERMRVALSEPPVMMPQRSNPIMSAAMYADGQRLGLIDEHGNVNWAAVYAAALLDDEERKR